MVQCISIKGSIATVSRLSEAPIPFYFSNLSFGYISENYLCVKFSELPDTIHTHPDLLYNNFVFLIFVVNL